MGALLHVSNLPTGVNEAILRMAFGEGGRTVKGVTIGTDQRTGRPARFGYVSMATAEEALEAIVAWDGKDLDGRRLTVRGARLREG